MMLDADLFGFLDHTADAAFTVTDGGEICSWNASAEALFGFGREEAVGRTCFELFQGRGALGTAVCAELCHVRECVAHHTPVPDFDLQVKTHSGRWIWVNMSTVVHEDPKTGRRRIVHFARSIADRKRADALVQRMLRTSKQLIEMSNDGLRPAPVIPLSEQERRVLRSFSEGQSPTDIARALNISAQTLRNHLHHINQKLGTHNRLEAVMHAIRRQLI
ncbi:MAG TPA: LuxR C-terminal-related transcriptional regulator [Vicinamibacterales bacterium]|nr:LuxR C-terminal-related transcriptional regulator [Vicinamibacterales bacterium]